MFTERVSMKPSGMPTDSIAARRVKAPRLPTSHLAPDDGDRRDGT
jgi:hypothetical protein